MSKKPRDYAAEYKKFQSSDKAKKDRASRNKARADAIKSGKAAKGDGKDIAHVDNNPRNNGASNTKSQSRAKNRGHGMTAPGKKKTTKRKKSL